MARGVRRKTIEEQIADIDSQMKELKEKKKELLAAKEQEDIRKLLDAAKEAGMTPAELVKKLLAADGEQ